MTARPYVLLSCAMSLDGRIDDCSPRRLILSGPADLDRVDEVRAGCDAILIGARTVRRDDPGLAVRSERRRGERVAAGRSPTPLRATLTASGRLDPGARFFRDDAEKIVYRFAGTGKNTASDNCASDNSAGENTAGEDSAAENSAGDGSAGRDLVGLATIVDLGEPPLVHLLADLDRRGVRRLLVEGGTSVHTAFLTAGLVDEIHLVVAPFFVGEPGAPTFVGPGVFPHDSAHRLTLAEVRQLDDVVLLRYLTHPGAT